MSRISLLSSYRNGIAKLLDKSAFRIAPEQIEQTADWKPGTEIFIKESDDEVWNYRLMSAGIPIKATVYEEESGG